MFLWESCRIPKVASSQKWPAELCTCSVGQVLISNRSSLVLCQKFQHSCEKVSKLEMILSLFNYLVNSNDPKILAPILQSVKGVMQD